MYIVPVLYKVGNNQSAGVLSSISRVNHIISIKVCQIDLTRLSIPQITCLIFYVYTVPLEWDRLNLFVCTDRPIGILSGINQKVQCIARRAAICWLDRLAEHRDLGERVHATAGHLSQASSCRAGRAYPQVQSWSWNR